MQFNELVLTERLLCLGCGGRGSTDVRKGGHEQQEGRGNRENLRPQLLG